jgi:hypothetical protein
MSTCVADYTYEPTTKSLTIYFVKGGSHTYTNVDQDLADGLDAASSKGQYFNARIRSLG